jgi:hypothetical protein
VNSVTRRAHLFPEPLAAKVPEITLLGPASVPGGSR